MYLLTNFEYVCPHGFGRHPIIAKLRNRILKKRNNVTQSRAMAHVPFSKSEKTPFRESRRIERSDWLHALMVEMYHVCVCIYIQGKYGSGLETNRGVECC